jgi:hypothetical protein
MRTPETPGMRNRGTGCVADNRARDGADRAKYHCARQGSKRGIAAAMFVRAGL